MLTRSVRHDRYLLSVLVEEDERGAKTAKPTGEPNLWKRAIGPPLSLRATKNSDIVGRWNTIEINLL